MFPKTRPVAAGLHDGILSSPACCGEFRFNDPKRWRKVDMTKIFRDALAALFVIAVMVIASLETIGAQDDVTPLRCATDFEGDYCGSLCDSTGFFCWPFYHEGTIVKLSVL